MKNLKKISMSVWIIIGFIAGIFCGLFFGELCKPLSVIGMAYVKLLQMCVLPYIVLSLITGIGNLSWEKAKMLAKKGGLLLLLFWAIGIFVIFSLPLAFPALETASFYSNSQTKEPEKFDFLDIYIPSNPFKSLAENLVPAVVLFSVCIGVALIGMEKKESLLDNFAIFSKALTRVNKVMADLSPLGVFALTASAAGTISPEELNRLQAYLICYIVGILLLTFWILPALVSAITSIRARDIINYSKDALILGLTIGNTFVILPVIAENSKKLLNKYKKAEGEIDNTVDLVLSIAFNFPLIGDIFSIFFILFTSWFYEISLSLFQQMDLMVSGIFSFFSSANVAIPFLLDHMKLPVDAFNLFLISEVITRRIKPVLSVMSLMAFTVILNSILINIYKINRKKLIASLIITLLFMTLSIGGTRQLLAYLMEDTYNKDKVLAEMRIDDPGLIKVPTKVYRTRPEEIIKNSVKPGKNMLLQEIKKRGVLRAGYNPASLPFAFFNQKEELVGYDIAYAYFLAEGLKCRLEFIPIDDDTMAEDLKNGVCHIVMSAIPVTAGRTDLMDFTDPYMTLQLAFVVKDYRRDDFKDEEKIKKMKNLKIAVFNGSDYIEHLKIVFPSAEIVEINSPEEFFKKDIADALLITAEQGAAWTLIYPSYGVVSSEHSIYKTIISYAIPKEQKEFQEYVNLDMYVYKEYGYAGEEYNYWILGKNEKDKKPRWCLIRDVFHWIE